jgi:hypothetical protein
MVFTNKTYYNELCMCLIITHVANSIRINDPAASGSGNESMNHHWNFSMQQNWPNTLERWWMESTRCLARSIPKWPRVTNATSATSLVILKRTAESILYLENKVQVSREKEIPPLRVLAVQCVLVVQWHHKLPLRHIFRLCFQHYHQHVKWVW